MATLGDLKARVADEILKRNLTTQIASHIARAIEFYADRRFWFNEAKFTASTTAGQSNVGEPNDPLVGVLRKIDMLNITVGGSAYELESQAWTTIEDWLGISTSGQPTDYALTTGQLVLYPTPDAVYPLSILGIFDLPTLADDAASNAWTNGGQDLIAARTRMTLYRDVLRDVEGMRLAQSAVDEALSNLTGKTTRKVGQGSVRLWL